MTESGVIEDTALVFGQMDEPPGTRLRVALSAPDDGGVLPRRAEAGRAAVHRQHLPVHPGRLRGLHAARPHAVRRGLPADPGRRDGPAAGADHLDPRPLDHLDAGDLRARRRHHRPGPAHGVRPPRRHHGAVAGDLGEGHLPGGGPAGLHLPDPGPAVHRPGALRRRPHRAADPAALQGAAGHHRHPRHRRALRGGPDHRPAGAAHRAVPVAADLRGRAVHRPAGRVRAAGGDDRLLQGDRATASTTTYPSRRSSCAAASRTSSARPRSWSASGRCTWSC